MLLLLLLLRVLLLFLLLLLLRFLLRFLLLFLFFSFLQGDFVAKDISLPAALGEGDFVVMKVRGFF